MDEPPAGPEEVEDLAPCCTGCGAELTPCRGNMPQGAIGALLAVAGLSASGVLLLQGETEWLPAGVAAFIIGIELTGDRLWWECPECGRQFTRLPPPATSTQADGNDTGGHPPPNAPHQDPEAE